MLTLYTHYAIIVFERDKPSKLKKKGGIKMANLNIRMTALSEMCMDELVEKSKYSKSEIVRNLIEYAAFIARHMDEEPDQTGSDWYNGTEIGKKLIKDLILARIGIREK